MKNKLLKLTMIVVIAIAVILGVYKIINSIMYDEDIDKTVANYKNTIFKRLSEEENEIERNNIMEYYIKKELININETGKD